MATPPSTSPSRVKSELRFYGLCGQGRSAFGARADGAAVRQARRLWAPQVSGREQLTGRAVSSTPSHCQ